MDAVALPEPVSYTEAAARGASVRIVSAGLTAPRVEITAPRAVADALWAAIGWRVEAMRAQLRDPLRRPGTTLRARPGLVLPMLPEVTWAGWRESYGRKVFVKLRAQRPVPGLCDSCGDPVPHETGDCALCNAARVAALRAEGLLPQPEPRIVPERQTEAAWRAELVADLPRRAAAPVVVPSWTCRVCGREVRGFADPDLECGPCEMRRASVMDTSRLGGGR